MFLSFPCALCADETPPVNRWEVKARKKELTPIQRRAYQQLARLHDFKGFVWNEMGNMDYDEFWVPTPNAMTILRDMDIDAIPILAEALDDETPTKTVIEHEGTPVHRPGWKPEDNIWKVNELAGRLIEDITNYKINTQSITRGDAASRAEQVRQVRNDTLAWYEKNKQKTGEQRKIDDLGGDRRLRLKAEFLLGRWKSVKAVPLLVKRIETIVASKTDDESERNELVRISHALGTIGDQKGLAAVKMACDFLASTPALLSERTACTNLFGAYYGLALFGRKKEALAQLKRIYEKHRSDMTPYSRENYEEWLAEAAKW
jgi:hypothetical protein